MRRIITAIGGTALASALLVGAVAAADPTPTPSPGATTAARPLTEVLHLDAAQIRELRVGGLSLAQIAERQQVALGDVIGALVARWQERIAARVANGALTTTEATTLTAQLQTKATELVERTTPGGMQGAMVGAGPEAGAGNGDTLRARDGSGSNGIGPRGTGDGTCDGTGPHGVGRP